MKQAYESIFLPTLKHDIGNSIIYIINYDLSNFTKCTVFDNSLIVYLYFQRTSRLMMAPNET